MLGLLLQLVNLHCCGLGFARLGEAVAKTLLNHLLKMFTTLGIYSKSFEKPFLECTSEFYAAEGMKYMQQADVPDYLKHVEVHISLFISQVFMRPIYFSNFLSSHLYFLNIMISSNYFEPI